MMAAYRAAWAFIGCSFMHEARSMLLFFIAYMGIPLPFLKCYGIINTLKNVNVTTLRFIFLN